MKKAVEKVPGGVAGVDAAGTNMASTRVEGSRPGGPAQSPDAVVKAEDEEEGEEGEEGAEHEGGETPAFEAGDEEEGEESAEKAKKSLTIGDLSKSLEALESFAKSGDLPSRKDLLLGKASAGSLKKSEREELFNLLGGGSNQNLSNDDAPAENIVKSMNDNDNLQKALDVSDYLQEQHTEMVKSLRRVGDEIQKSDHRRHEFNMILAKAVKDIGDLVKALNDTVGTMAGQPARAPKSLGVVKPAQVLQKSFMGQPVAGENLNKSQVLDALDGLMEESMAKGMSGATDFGEDISLACAKYEQTNMISRPMLDAVKGYLQKRTAA